jgi:hypothetical protein
MIVKELIKELLEYNMNADVFVSVNSKDEKFTLAYGGSEGCNKTNCENVSLYIDSSINNESTKHKEMDNIVYFQPPNINPKYCEAGMISQTDKDYIWYLEEPCKILLSDVKIIPKENVIYNKKKRLYEVKQKDK